MRYYARVNELEKKIDYLKKQLDIIDECIKNLENSKHLIKWQGLANDSFNKKTDQYIKKLKNIEKSTVVCIDYFMQYYGKYGEEYKRFKTKYARFFKPEVKNELTDI